ncbi:hypothetical protein [Conexibacter sp. DBS9H8]|uniref:TPR end-of-group domain-containing protein n=1 Tax=Conexibacter sp. DBS9H8 TaxID=2937801 RepID=UPI00201009B7|nr:hypothetical protein [Conexibacter sp. DBS9H8]
MEAGRHEELIARAESLLAGEVAYPELLYNVACSESRLGRHADALAHLRSAVALMPELARFARDDADLNALADLPEFRELIDVPSTDSSR